MEKLFLQIRNGENQYMNAILYYVLLIGMMIAVLRPMSGLPFPIRVGLLILSLLPSFSNPRHLPFFMTCLVVISTHTFSPIFPTTPIIYLAIILSFSFYYGIWNTPDFKALGIFFAFLIFDIGFGDFSDRILWWLIAILLADFIKDKQDICNLMMAFILTSFVLSVLFLLYKDYFIMDYYLRRGVSLERSSWINTNLFGAIISAGATMAVAYLSRLILVPRKRFPIFISTATLILALFTLVINASRGAFLAFIIPSMIMLLLSKIKKSYKVVILIAIFFILYITFFTTDIFNLLSTRLQEESLETGGSRTEIWKQKLSMFLSDYGIFSYLFGIGYKGSVTLAWNISTHNDFLTAFIGYGFFGLTLISLMIFYPFIIAPKRLKKLILCLTIYMIIECFVLEPIFRGYLFFLMFYIFTLKYVLIEKKEYEKEVTIYFTNLRNRWNNSKHEKSSITIGR